MLADLELLLDDYVSHCGKEYETIISHSKLDTDHCSAVRHISPTHIDYIIPDDDLKANQYATFFANECTLRGIRLSMDDDVEEWREELRLCIKKEKHLKLLYTFRKWKQDGVLKIPVVAFVELLIQCILHLENRVGEKIITMIL